MCQKYSGERVFEPTLVYALVYQSPIMGMLVLLQSVAPLLLSSATLDLKLTIYSPKLNPQAQV